MATILEILRQQTPLMLFILILMLLAVIIDLITGIRKAKINGEATTSTGFRKTCKKLMQYVIPLLAFFIFDWMLCIMPFYELPYLSLIYGGFCTLTEAKSIIENTHTSQEKKDMLKSVTEIASNINDKDELIKAIVKQVMAEEKANTDNIKLD